MLLQWVLKCLKSPWAPTDFSTQVDYDVAIIRIWVLSYSIDRCVNMNYIKSLLFLDVCIEIVTVKQSALSLFALCAFMFLFFYVRFFFFSGVWFIVTVVVVVACTLLRALIKINQSHVNLLYSVLEYGNFLDSNISQSSVATLVRFGGIFNADFIANLLTSLVALWKSVSIWRCYRKRMVPCFLIHSVCTADDKVFIWFSVASGNVK